MQQIHTERSKNIRRGDLATWICATLDKGLKT